MRRMLAAGPIALFTLSAACGPSAEEQAAQQAEELRLARADSVAQAEAIYDAAAFDTIQWVSPDSALVRGQVVWRFSCQKCHAADGGGGGELALQHELAMPNLRAADWRLAGDIPAIRRSVFVGHESEMPNWGLHGISSRDIDAVAKYIDSWLRTPAANP